MRYSSSLCFSLCLFLLFFSTTMAAPADPVDLLQFTVQWQPGKCSAKGTTCTVKPTQRFTMHGIWPANSTGTSIINCQGSALANEQQLTKNVPDLKTYWPDVENGKDYIFWTNEWNKHGKCCEQQIKQVDYFKLAGQILGKYDILDILKKEQLVPNNQLVDKTKVQQAIIKGIGKAPALNCKKKSVVKTDQLVEVVLCLNKTGKTLIDCPGTLRFHCDDMFLFSKP